MKIGVLSRNSEFWATSEIMKALRNKNAEPIYLHTPKIHLTLEDEKVDAVFNKMSLSRLDAVIPRVGRSLTQLGIMLLRQLELMEIPSTLSTFGLMIARNKYLALQTLHAAGVKIPASVLIATRNRSEETMEYMSPPLVMKLLSGTQGVGVMLVRDVKEAGPIIDTLSELQQIICLQKYLPNPGEDIRVFRTGKEVVGAMRRKAAPHEWRSNIHMGGYGIAHKLSERDGNCYQSRGGC
jgi:ribosomal protein S6--L-glutamate ligase